MKQILRRQKSRPFCYQVYLASLPVVTGCYCHGALVDESGMIRFQVGDAH
jgi:hypothetical protein